MAMTVIFRTHSDSEASIVSGLLEANGVPSVVSASITHALFPLTVSDLGEVRISVPEDAADEALRIIDDHRAELPSGQVSRGRPFEALELAIAYRFHDGALLEGFAWTEPAAGELQARDLIWRNSPSADPAAFALAGSHVFYGDRRDQSGLLRRVGVEWP